MLSHKDMIFKRYDHNSFCPSLIFLKYQEQTLKFDNTKQTVSNYKGIKQTKSYFYIADNHI